MNNTISENGYRIIDGILRDFSAEDFAKIQQRAADIITGLMLGMKEGK